MLRRWIGLGLLFVTAACSGGGLSLSEYAAQGQALTTVMEERIAALDAEWETQPPTVERARSYWEHRIDALLEARAGLEELEPPPEVAELHGPGMELFTELIEAEQALAARIESLDVATGPDDWWSTEEAEVVNAVNEEILSLCLGFQAMYDATIERMSFTDVPWIPSNMKEIVSIDVGCEA